MAASNNMKLPPNPWGMTEKDLRAVMDSMLAIVERDEDTGVRVKAAHELNQVAALITKWSQDPKVDLRAPIPAADQQPKSSLGNLKIVG